MKFLCDVHISYKIVKFFSDLGFEAIHVNTILEGCETKDKDICRFADLNDLKKLPASNLSRTRENLYRLQLKPGN